LVLLLGLGACAFGLVATVPVAMVARIAGVALPVDMVLSGTLWHGRAQIAGHTATWDLRPTASLTTASLATHLQIAGPGTDVQGDVTLRPGRITVAQLTGPAAWPLLAAALPGLEIRCDAVATLAMNDIAISAATRRARGQINVAAGTCDRVDGTVTGVAVPALLAQIATDTDGITGVVTAVADPATPLARATLTPSDRLQITIHRAGAAMVPGLPNTADSQIDLPLGLILPY
jgi:Type II secretion system (T2SS), protein N